MSDQNKTPLVLGLKAYQDKRMVSFDVPGHKQGKSNKALVDTFGTTCVALDYNSSAYLDNLANPTSIIKEAQELAAKAFFAKHAFFMVNGTTSSVMAMILASVKVNEKIIMPRNVHKSALNALILSGAIPIYVDPGLDKELGISLAMSLEDIKAAMLAHPDAKAVFVNNPTYYGVTTNLKDLVVLARSMNMKVLVDEAHGAHFSFNDDLPISAMQANAHMASVSMHKTGGSFTQSSLLLVGQGMDVEDVFQVVNLIQTTSPSYLLMGSLDVARANLATSGKEMFDQIIKMTQYARNEINQMGGYLAFSKERINHTTWFDFDQSKLSIHTHAIGLSGKRVYDILRDEYQIQIEFGDISNILAIISVGDRQLEIERLIAALQDIKHRYSQANKAIYLPEYVSPLVIKTPQVAFYGNKKSVALKDSLGCIAAEMMMAYPPGIPIIAPGEMITKEVLEYISAGLENNNFLIGAKDKTFETIQVLED